MIATRRFSRDRSSSLYRHFSVDLLFFTVGGKTPILTLPVEMDPVLTKLEQLQPFREDAAMASGRAGVSTAGFCRAAEQRNALKGAYSARG